MHWGSWRSLYSRNVDSLNVLQCIQVSKTQVHHILTKTYGHVKPYTPSTVVNKDNIKPIFDLVLESYLDDSQTPVADIIKAIKDKYDETVRLHINTLVIP